MATVDAALRNHPNHPGLLGMRARTLDRMGWPAEAAQIYGAFADTLPPKSPIHLARANVLMRLERYTEARHALARAEQSLQHDLLSARIALLDGDAALADTLFTTAEVVDAAASRLARARALRAAERLEEARFAFEQVLDHDPSCLEAYVALEELVATDRPSERLSVLLAAAPGELRGTPDFRLRFELPVLQRNTDYDRIDALLREGRMEDASPAAWTKLAQWHVALAQWEDGERAITGGLSAYPGTPALLIAKLRLFANVSPDKVTTLRREITERLGPEWSLRSDAAVPSWLHDSTRRAQVVAWITGPQRMVPPSLIPGAILSFYYSNEPGVLKPLIGYLDKRDVASTFMAHVLGVRLQNVGADAIASDQSTLPDQRDRLARIVRATRPQLEAESDLASGFATLSRLQERAKQSWLWTGEDPSDARHLAQWLRQRIDNAQPTTVVRLGDGEGLFLPPKGSARQNALDRRRNQMLAGMGGIFLSEEEADAFAWRMRKAVASADLLGVPQHVRLAREFGRSNASLNVGGRGIRNVIDTLSELMDDGWTAEHVATANLHADLAMWDQYGVVLDGLESVSLIGPHDVEHVLDRLYGIGVRTQHWVPGHAGQRVMFPANTAPRDEPPYPNMFERIDSALDPRPGEVFLVAGGLWSKLWGETIRDRGGIAIDVGSQMDRWAGRDTRAYGIAPTLTSPNK